MTVTQPAPRAADLMAPMAPFIRDEWYVAAFAAELAAAPIGRTICGEPIALFRRADGGVVALEDRCSHRRYPLSRGKIVGNELQCLYHGARFDGAGRCVAIPGQDMVPASFNLRAYPTHEQDGVVFLWPGDAAKARGARRIVLHAREGSKDLYRKFGFVDSNEMVLAGGVEEPHPCSVT